MLAKETIFVFVAVCLSYSCVIGDKCYGTPSHPCWCQLNSGEELDLTYYEKKSPLAYDVGPVHFTYDPCNDFQCNPNLTNVTICLYNSTSREYFGLGRVTTYYIDNPWTVHSYTPYLNLTITYNGGDEVPSGLIYSTVNVIEDRYSNESVFQFITSKYLKEKRKYKFEFILITPHVFLKIPAPPSKRYWIAGAVVGSWFPLQLRLSYFIIGLGIGIGVCVYMCYDGEVFLVVLVSVIVIAILSISRKMYKQKLKGPQYQRVQNITHPINGTT